MKKPNLFVVGAAKSGTTSIYDYLGEHPDIYMSPVKEPHHFCSDIRLSNFTQPHYKSFSFDIDHYLKERPLKRRHIAYIDDLKKYESLYDDANGERYAGECSVGYLYSLTAAKNIHAYSPDARIIISLREPVDRAYSHWKMNLAGGRESYSQPFRECLSAESRRSDNAWGITFLYVELGLYYAQIKRYLDVFPRENIYFAMYSDLTASPQQFMDGIFSFLGLESIQINPAQKSNRSRRPRSVFLRNMARKLKLTQYFGRDLVERIKVINSVDDFPEVSRDERGEIYASYYSDEHERLEELLGRALPSLKL